MRVSVGWHVVEFQGTSIQRRKNSKEAKNGQKSENVEAKHIRHLKLFSVTRKFNHGGNQWPNPKSVHKITTNGNNLATENTKNKGASSDISYWPPVSNVSR